MNYYDHNAIEQGLRRVRASFVTEHPYKLLASHLSPAEPMPRPLIIARRSEGADLRTRHAFRFNARNAF